MAIWRKIEVQEQWQTALSQNAAGYVLKAYQAGAFPGSTIPIAIDSNGSTTVGTVTLNADGLPEVSSNEVVLYIDQDFTYAIYENASDAAANTNAFFGPVDVYDTIATEVANASGLFDQFDDRYLGDKDTEPTLDNDGDALIVGALYWNRTNNEMRVFDGTFWGPITPWNSLTLSLIGFVFSSIAYSGVSHTYEAQDIAFDPTGTKMFVIDNSGTNQVTQWNLVSAYNLVGATNAGSYAFQTEAGINGTGQGLALNPSGTKMFVMTDSSGPSAQLIWEYDLSTGFDITTVTYSGTSFDISGQDTNPTCMVFNPAGTKFFIGGLVNDAIFEYDMTTAFDLSTASYSTNSFSILAQQTSIDGFRFNTDGTKMYLFGSSPNSFHEYNLSTGFDITTPVYSGNAAPFDFALANNFVFNGDGTKIFASAGTTGSHIIYEYGSNVVFAY